jgi:hypothetical protein
MVHCRKCRTLLNPELRQDSVEVPVFIPLRELDAMVELTPQGVFVGCPKCAKELRINRKYMGQRVQCKFCEADFRLDPASPSIVNADVYSKCPHCEQELRFAKKYVGMKVACRFCKGKLHVLDKH